MTDLFISYSRDDSLTMGLVRDNLRKLGFNLWIDVEHLQPGTPQWSRAVRNAIGQCDGMLVLCSPSAEQSEWVNREVHMARLADKPIVPILVSGDEWDAIPTDLIGAQYVDMRGRSNPAQGFGELVRWLADTFGLDLPDYTMQESGDLSIPAIHIVNVEGHVEGDIISVGGDIKGDLNVAGRDVISSEISSPSAVTEKATSRARSDTMPIYRQRGVWAGVGGLLVIVVVVGLVLATGLFTPGGGEAETPGETAVAEAQPTSDDDATQAVTDVPITPTPTDLPTPTDIPEPTLTASPTPIGGGSGRIAFESDRTGNWELYLMDPDGSNLINLTNHQADDHKPTWSPDGSRIAFESSRNDTRDIYVMDADGSNLTNLTNERGYDTDPAWSPDGSRIAFVTDRDNSPEIYVMNTDGSGLVNLSNNLNANDWAPAWSPDGSRIAFYSNPDRNFEIYVMDADGSNVILLTSSSKWNYSPNWSPDGRHIVFVSERDGNAELYVMDTDGSNLTRLTNNPASDTSPAWSPDGNQIAFVSDRDGNQEIYIMDANGSNPINLTNSPEDERQPAWSP